MKHLQIEKQPHPTVWHAGKKPVSLKAAKIKNDQRFFDQSNLSRAARSRGSPFCRLAAMPATAFPSDPDLQSNSSP